MKNLKASKLIALLLALCLTLPLLASCQKNEDTDEEKPADEETTFLDSVETQDYNGYEFTFGVQAENEFEMFSEEAIGSSESDSIYNRNQKVGKRFNITISQQTYDGGAALQSAFETGVAAGDCPFDVAAQYAYYSGNLIMKREVLDWNEVDELDLSAEWWNQLANDCATVNGHLFPLTGDISLTSTLYLWGVFVNLDLADDWGIDTDALYQEVLDGKWTIEKLNNYVKNIYKDLNGDGERNLGDLYGFMAHDGDTSDVWTAAFDNPIISRTEDDELTITFMTDKIIDGYDQIYYLYKDNPGSYDECEWSGEPALMAQSKMVFSCLKFYDCFSGLKDMKDSYGILPYPKLNEEQDNYYTIPDDIYSTLCLPISTEDTTMVGKIIEALAAESYNSVVPTWLDVGLKGKYSNDIQTREIVDIIRNGVTYDLSMIFAGKLGNLAYLVRNSLLADRENISSQFASCRGASENALKIISVKIPE